MGSVTSEREQLTLKRSPTQVKTNSAVLQHNVVLIFFLSFCLPYQLLRVISVFSGKKLIQLPLINQMFGCMKHFSLRLSALPSELP